VATYLAGVDNGTSGAKAMMFDLARIPLPSAYQEYPCTYPAGIQNCEQRLIPTANPMIGQKPKILRIRLTNGLENGRMVNRVCYIEQDEELLHNPEERGMKPFDFSAVNSENSSMCRKSAV
jgi:hypothetical protein